MKKHFVTLLVSCLLMSVVVAQKNAIKPFDATLSGYEYPYSVSFLTLNIQQHAYKMAYMDVKPANYNGKTIVLFHGKNFNGAYWKTTIEALTQRGYRVVAPDQLGFGKSDKPEYFQYSFHQLAENTMALLKKLQIKKTTILGHSMGGMLATRFALMYPDVTEKLILENPIGLEDYKVVVPYRNVDWWYQNELEKNYESLKKYQQSNYYDGKWKPEYDEWVNILAGWILGNDYKRVAWNNALTYDMILTQPVVYEFQDIKCPTLLIIGTRDRTALGKPLVNEETRKTMGLYNKLGKATRDKIPNSKLVEIPNIGHLPHIEAFNKFITPLLNFLEK